MADLRATLCGYPGQLIETTEKICGEMLYRDHNFRFLTLVTNTIPRAKWPSKNLKRPLKEACDLLVRFETDGELFHENMKDLDATPEKSRGATDVKLHGMSGCGMWMDYANENGTWEPKPRLIGIQTSALHASHGWARGTQIEHWLQLVEKHYPDLPRYLENALRKNETSY